MELLFVIILLLIAFWNAYVILWKTGNQKRQKLYSKIWHAIGLFLRIVVWAGVPIILMDSGKWSWNILLLYTSLFIIVGGILYDFIINLIRYLYEGKPTLWYVDNKGWNKMFLKYLTSKMYWIVRFVIGLLLILILFI